MNRMEHWEKVYRTKSRNQLSWTQESPRPSLDWILETLPERDQAIIDIGGGNSALIDALLQAGYARPSVLDISGEALTQSRARLGEHSSKVDWIQSDVTRFQAQRPFALWHDRAVFHFLTSAEDRAQYVKTMKRSLDRHGKAIIATFSPNGPLQCSGLEIVRFDEVQLSKELGDGFRLMRHMRVEHTTPWDSKQEFTYCLFEALS